MAYFNEDNVTEQMCIEVVTMQIRCERQRMM